MSLHLLKSSLLSRTAVLFSSVVFCLCACAGLRAQPETKAPGSAAEAKQKLAPLFLKQSELRKEKNWVQLEVVERQIVELARVGHGRESAAVSQFMVRLATTLLQQEKFGEAEQLMRESLAMRQKLYPAGSWEIANVQIALGEILLAAKKFAEAEAILLSAYAAVNMPNPDSHEISNLKNTTKLLATLYQATDQPTKAADW